MNTPLRALIVEDSADDARLVVRALERAGYDLTWERVETATGMQDALARQPWEVILADYNLPSFSGLEALRIARERQPDAPFILVSGSVGEETAVESMRAGAHDYVMKDRLARLAPAVERALREAEMGRQQRALEARVREEEARFRALVEKSHEAVSVLDREGRNSYASPSTEWILGYRAEEIIGRMAFEFVHPDDLAMVRADFADLIQRVGGDLTRELRCVRRDGAVRWFDVVATNLLHVPSVQGIVVNYRDVTERKRISAALQESEEKFRRLFVSSQDAIMTVESPSWRFTSGNPATLKMFRAKTEEAFIAYGPWELSPDRQPDGRRSVEKSKEMIETAVRQGSHHFEWIHRRIDGDEFPADVLLTRMGQGEKVVIQATIRDLTERKRAEAALREEQAMFNSLTSTIPDHIYFKDRHSRFVRINASLARHFELSGPDEVAGKTDFDFFDKEHARRAYETEQRLLRTGEPLIDLEEQEIWSDGHVTWASTTKMPLRDAQGHITGLVGVSRDITERKRTEAALHASREQLNLALDAANDGLWDWHIPSGRAYFGPRYYTMLGYEPGEFPASAEAWQNLMHPDDRPAVQNTIQKFLAAGSESYAIEFRLKTKPGGWCWVLSRGKVVERDAAGQAVRMVGTHSDITERKRAEERIRDQAALLDRASDAIYVTALDYTILYWNRAAERIYGWSAAEAVGRKTTEFISTGDSKVTDAVTAMVQKGDWSGERQQTTKAGRPVEVLSRLTLLRDDQGQPRSILVINTDITEKKALESQFLRAQRLESIGALASGIAHDLNNVLAPIIMGAPLLRDLAKEENARKLLTMIETSARRGADIVKQVLTFARGTEGQRVSLQPKHLVRDVVGMIGETFPKNIQIEDELPAGVWPVAADATQLHQALMNLCINARDAMPTGGKLVLSLDNVSIDEAAAAQTPGAKAGPYVRWRVADTGTGMPPEVQNRIFEPFFTTKEPGKGTGLGLSTVLGIVRGHGGFIRVDSQQGRGTTFELFIPATPAAAPAARPGSVHPWPRAQGELVLLVDDENAVREVARQALTEFGYQVVSCASGAEAIARFRASPGEVRLVVTDMMMPEMDGPALVKALRAIEPGVPILGITGVSDVATMGRLRTQGLSALLAKPFTIGQLLSVVHEAIQPGANPATQ